MAGGNPAMQAALMGSAADSLGHSSSGGSGGGLSSILNALEDPWRKSQLDKSEKEFEYQLRDWETQKKQAYASQQAQGLSNLIRQMGENMGKDPEISPEEKQMIMTAQTLGSAGGLEAAIPLIQDYMKNLTQAQGKNIEMTAGQKDFSQARLTPEYESFLRSSGQNNTPAAIQEFEYLQGMDPASQSRFLELKGRIKDPNNAFAVSRAQAEGESGIKERGTRLDKELTDVRARSQAVSSITHQMETLDSLLDESYTGAYADKVKSLQGIAKALGLPVSDETLASKEAATAVANELALKFRDPNAGAGMPGSLSDTDREFLTSMTPGILMSKDGRKRLLKIYRGMADRAEEIATEAEIYAEENEGKLDSKWYRHRRELEKKYKSTPILKDEAPAQAAQPSASGPVRVNTIEEARALPPGTKFIDPNGIPRVR